MPVGCLFFLRECGWWGRCAIECNAIQGTNQVRVSRASKFRKVCPSCGVRITADAERSCFCLALVEHLASCVWHWRAAHVAARAAMRAREGRMQCGLVLASLSTGKTGSQVQAERPISFASAAIFASSRRGAMRGGECIFQAMQAARCDESAQPR